ncbi:MAG TPA: N-acetylmuramoyl-L-alanine amidase [Armatimonadota bacterium]
MPRFPPIARFPNGIVIHHTASPPYLHGGRLVDAAVLDTMHAEKGFGAVRGRDGTVYHIAYHFVILQDGTVQRGRPEYLPGAHTLGHPEMLGIVLVGNFHGPSNLGNAGPLTPPPALLAAAARLTRELMANYHLSVRQVYLHRDLRPTACPGDHFPRATFYDAITR